MTLAKSALAYILNSPHGGPLTSPRWHKPDVDMNELNTDQRTEAALQYFRTIPLKSPTTPAKSHPTIMACETEKSTHRIRRKKKTSLCQVDGCNSQALSKLLCMKHGGGPRCIFPGCSNGAKLKNVCFQHGGSTICIVDQCTSKAKRFGYCWSHGGGRICRQEGCSKVSAQGGLCWAHGGGNRCKLNGCTKRSYKQNGYYCKGHADALADY